MPHSLKAKLSGLRYKGIISHKDYKVLCDALNTVKAIETIKSEIEVRKEFLEIKFGHTIAYHEIRAYEKCLEIIDNYTTNKEEPDADNN